MSNLLPRLSCVVLASDSHVDKGGCLLHCVTSLINQDHRDFEVVVVENSHHRSDELLAQLRQLVENTTIRERSASVRVVEIANPVSRGRARNIGAQEARGSVLVFIDDDTLVRSTDALSKIDAASQSFALGYGARRLWTPKGDWFIKNSTELLAEMKEGKWTFDEFLALPKTTFREGADEESLSYSFIGNFGFCRRDEFELAGGFPDLAGYGFEDDWLTFQVVRRGFLVASLSDLVVTHVWHDVPMNNASVAHASYCKELRLNGYDWCHTLMPITDGVESFEDMLEPAHLHSFDYPVREAIEDYRVKAFSAANAKEVDERRGVFDDIDLGLAIDALLQSSCLEEVFEKRPIDLDNMAPVIDACLSAQLIQIDDQGKLHRRYSPESWHARPANEALTPMEPLEHSNQFPCDLRSRGWRFSFINRRYPISDQVSLALIGDDDLVGTTFGAHRWVTVHVFDNDPRIVEATERHAPSVYAYLYDVRDEIPAGVKVHTFMTDPPYTFNGALAFISRGMQLVEFDGQEREFYVFLNPSLMKGTFESVVLMLASNGVWLHETLLGVSKYALPSAYEETRRAEQYFARWGIEPKRNSTSSSSNLYVFRTKKPNMEGLLGAINLVELYPQAKSS